MDTLTVTNWLLIVLILVTLLAGYGVWRPRP